MKVVASTDEYTIFARRDGRYAVVNKDKQPVNGDEKVAILVEHDLIKAVAPKPAEEEPVEETGEEAGEGAGEETQEEESGDAAEE